MHTHTHTQLSFLLAQPSSETMGNPRETKWNTSSWLNRLSLSPSHSSSSFHLLSLSAPLTHFLSTCFVDLDCYSTHFNFSPHILISCFYLATTSLLALTHSPSPVLFFHTVAASAPNFPSQSSSIHPSLSLFPFLNLTRHSSNQLAMYALFLHHAVPHHGAHCSVPPSLSKCFISRYGAYLQSLGIRMMQVEQVAIGRDGGLLIPI